MSKNAREAKSSRAFFYGGKIVMSGSGSAITTTGVRGFGLSVEGAGSQAQVADTAMQVSGSRAFGISIKAGGTALVNNSSVALNGSTGPFSPAVQVEGIGSNLTINNSNVSTTTPTVAVGVGVTARDGANLIISNSTITRTGPNSAALTASSLTGSPGTVTANNVTITTSGDDNAMGAIADLNGTMILNGGNQVRQSSYAHGLGARNPGGNLTANGTVVHTSGLSAMGVWSDDGGNSILNDVRIAGELERYLDHNPWHRCLRASRGTRHAEWRHHRQQCLTCAPLPNRHLRCPPMTQRYEYSLHRSSVDADAFSSTVVRLATTSACPTGGKPTLAWITRQTRRLRSSSPPAIRNRLMGIAIATRACSV
jgi:hypothetical protein